MAPDCPQEHRHPHNRAARHGELAAHFSTRDLTGQRFVREMADGE